MKIRILIGKVFGDDDFISVTMSDGRAVVLSLLSDTIIVYKGDKAYVAELRPADLPDVQFYLPTEGEVKEGIRKVVEGDRMYLVAGNYKVEVGKIVDVEI
ncbi:hypothetical protein Pogu_2126 [Pyrobaculum oguniense TE7]|uniref:Uncharacterized protein n=1 Tax=Pyrobaculum oguniense (strain DSM 13380 / JCM 10595 / TE7) TaxID=698757 RepID=H6QCV7_PYROT|nr:hypothetical protein Pogu_2126 [Pyrobaculum oguniense TE7]